MRILLRDTNPAVAQALAQAFADVPDVDVACDNIFSAGPVDAIVSPANSRGWMDGGIDLVYLHRFGWQLQDRLMAHIQQHCEGHLSVGRALIVNTGARDIPFMVSAPTMERPMAVPDTDNAYQAFRAALLVAKEAGFKSLLCPGLCTLTGRMDPAKAAQQMRRAWDEVYMENNQEPSDMNTSDASIEQEIQARDKTAPRVTPQDIEDNIVSEHYFTALDGVAGALAIGGQMNDIANRKALGLLTFCVLVLRNGFTVTGESACVSPENFNAEIGRKVARQNAVQKIWPLMGYALKERLHAEQ